MAEYISPDAEEWYYQNLCLLDSHELGEIFYDDISYTWIKVTLFPLPDMFNKECSALLIDTPGDAIEKYDAYSFFMDQDLERNDGKECIHLIDQDNYNPWSESGWTRLSFHLEAFDPCLRAEDGDTYLDILQALYNFLGKDWEKY